jgi:hypothetical protein
MGSRLYKDSVNYGALSCPKERVIKYLKKQIITINYGGVGAGK